MSQRHRHLLPESAVAPPPGTRRRLSPFLAVGRPKTSALSTPFCLFQKPCSNHSTCGVAHSRLSSTRSSYTRRPRHAKGENKTIQKNKLAGGRLLARPRGGVCRLRASRDVSVHFSLPHKARLTHTSRGRVLRRMSRPRWYDAHEALFSRLSRRTRGTPKYTRGGIVLASGTSAHG